MPTKAADQLSLDERVIVDAELEAALEERQRTRMELAPFRRAAREAHDAAKFAALRHDDEIPDGGAVRVGRFRITKTVVKGRAVSFEAGERTQLSFALLEA